VVCVHRTGDLKVGDMAVWVGAAGAHRDEAFRACRYVIDAIKHRLPIWKKEHYLEGDTAWVACSHSHDHALTWTPDYSRQTRLREVGAEGQAKLAAARVLVIGAGGLGSPALSYLAGAGVGTLGIVDGDRLEASNLHRQTLYDARDVGQPKAELAARRVRALNPEVKTRTFTEALDATNAAEVFADFDLVLECTDNLASRYLSSDVAVLTGTPLVLASVYQYEGQLQVVTGGADTPCLRCLWPEEPSPDAAGSCSEAGVLGPVPGVLGAMQAMEALKILLDLPRPDDHALVLVNLLDHSVRRLPVDPATGCATRNGCMDAAREALAQAADASDIERRFERLGQAVSEGYVLVDLRDADEIACQPVEAPTRCIPYARIADRADELAIGPCLLLCSHGQRSGHAARLLRQRGLREVYSLAGGLQALRPSHVHD
jgi:adenylyltransferase/sulfurtransferase